MTAISRLRRSVKPGAIVTLPPSAFEANWKDRPHADVAVGLRLLSVREIMECRVEAEREATGVYDEHPAGAQPMQEVIVEQYNEILLCEMLARALCDPNNVLQPYFQQAVVTIRSALTSEALQRLWDEYVKMSVTSGILMAEASDDEVKILARALRSGACRKLLDKEARKLVAYLLTKVRDAVPSEAGDERFFAGEPEEDDDVEIVLGGDDEGESIYVSRSAAPVKSLGLMRGMGVTK